MSGPQKRIPGQSNAEYGRRGADPAADFVGANSLEGGGDWSWFVRLPAALSNWLSRRRDARMRSSQER